MLSSSIRINPALSAVTNLTVVIGPLVGSAITSVFSLVGMVVLRKRVDRAVEEERLLGTNQGSRR